MPIVPGGFLAGAAFPGAVLVVYSIPRLLRVMRESILVRLPAAPEQDVRFAAAGTAVLCNEQSHLGTRGWGAIAGSLGRRTMGNPR